MTKNNQVAIIKALQEGKSVDQIAVDLKVEEKAIEEFLNNLKDLIDKPEPLEPGIKKAVLDKVIHQLSQMGLTKVSINNKINRIIKATPKDQLPNILYEGLLGDCLSLLNAHDVMINKTNSGNSGVTIMTEAGSQKGDTVVAPGKKSPHVFNIF